MTSDIISRYPIFESSKLFYGKYLYRVSVLSKSTSPLTGPNGLSYKKRTHNLKSKLEDILYHDIGVDFRTRGEMNKVSVFLNDREGLKSFIKKISKSKKEKIVDIQKPKFGLEKYFEQHKNLIITEEAPKFPLRCTFGGKNFDSESFYKWIEANPDKIYLSIELRKDFRRFKNPVLSGRYFHVKNRKTLEMIEFIIGGSIRKVEYLASENELKEHGGPVEK